MPKMRLHVDLKKRFRLRFRAVQLRFRARHWWMREAFMRATLDDSRQGDRFKSMFLGDWSPLPSEEKPPELHKEWSVGRLYPKQQEMLNDPRPMRLFGGSRR